MTNNKNFIVRGPQTGLSFSSPRRQSRLVRNRGGSVYRNGSFYRGGTVYRNGSVVPLIAILLPVFCIFIAFAVDYGVISLSRQQLQNAADAGAVAAIETYFQDIELGDQAASDVITNSQLMGSNIDFDIGQSIEYGRWDADTGAFTVITRTSSAGAKDTSGTSIPPGANAARVNLIRSAENGNAIGLFFAPIFGTDFATVNVSSIASAAAT